MLTSRVICHVDTCSRAYCREHQACQRAVKGIAAREKQAAWPKPGERWLSKDGRTCRVMAVAEGYVVARFKGAGPFLLHANDWPKRFERRVG